MNGLFGSTSVQLTERVAVRFRELYPEQDVSVDGTLGWVGVPSSVMGMARRDNLEAQILGSGAILPAESMPSNPSVAASGIIDIFRNSPDEWPFELYGSFVALVADRDRGTTSLAVLPHSVHGFFVAEVDGEWAWSTRLYPLATALGKGFDRSYEDFMLLYGFYPYGRTSFINVTSVEPGNLVYLEKGSIRWATIPDIDPWGGDLLPGLEDATDREAADVLRVAFMRALEQQAPQADEVGVLLGGFDSALVASGLVEIGKKVSTFTFRYEAEEYNQAHTDTVSQFLGTDHHWVTITESDIARGLDNYALDFNRLTNWPNYVIQTAIVAERIADAGIEHVLTGDGCDYLFFGYPLSYRRNRVINSVPKLPPSVHRPLVWGASRPSLDWWLGRPYQVGAGVLRAWGREDPQRSHLSFKVMDEVSLRNLRTGAQPVQEQDIETIIEDLATPFDGLDSLRITYLGKLFLAPYRIKMQGSSESAGISIQAPYLHKGMREVALALPESLLRPDDSSKQQVIGKYALTKMADWYKMLPPEVIYQRKMGAVDAPLIDWYAGELKSTLEGLYADLPFPVSTGYVNRMLTPKRSEAMYSRLISRDTADVVSISHGASLLATYGSMTRWRP